MKLRIDTVTTSTSLSISFTHNLTLFFFHGQTHSHQSSPFSSQINKHVNIFKPNFSQKSLSTQHLTLTQQVLPLSNTFISPKSFPFSNGQDCSISQYNSPHTHNSNSIDLPTPL
ncbi:unnamed protein product [Vicia faba]|uniref:Uncharacterized protein n=1 Tax=Vicia faba TaxID=3906 RepID=A0AAV0ZXI3_VICFA|nr:unnamed protein product [Vicia faba]